MMKVYVEHGALREELYSLQWQGRIELMTFPYEMKIRGVPRRALPSAAQFGDLANITIGELNFPIGEMSPSPAYSQILGVVGRRSRRDALHIDSAHKSGCKAFFSRDSKDIIAHREALEALLQIRFFHPDADWEAFISFLEPS